MKGLKIKVKPIINLTVVVSFSFNGKFYDIGHKFHVIGSDPIRGWDIADDYGNEIYECKGFATKHFEIINDND